MVPKFHLNLLVFSGKINNVNFRISTQFRTESSFLAFFYNIRIKQDLVIFGDVETFWQFTFSINILRTMEWNFLSGYYSETPIFCIFCI